MGDKHAGPITVEVAYALPREQALVTVSLPCGATALDAIRLSGLPERYPDISALLGQPGAIGIYGKVVAADAPLADRDRVELYRPLTVDPKEARRRRARLRVEKVAKASRQA